jgi:hypothetical protein
MAARRPARGYRETRAGAPVSSWLGVHGATPRGGVPARCQAGLRHDPRGAGDRLSPIEIDEVLAIYRVEGGRLAAAARAACLSNGRCAARASGRGSDPSNLR